MTEEEWTKGQDFRSMLQTLGDSVSRRKALLLSSLIVRRVSSTFSDPLASKVLAAIERVAEGTESESVLRAQTEMLAEAIASAGVDPFGNRHSFCNALTTACDEMENWRTPTIVRNWLLHILEETNSLPSLVRELFGNPFRPVAFDPRWRTADVTDLARAIYEDRAFERLPLLADALMDAGCEDEQVIGHCRGPGPHVRGCWVVDLVLGKE